MPDPLSAPLSPAAHSARPDTPAPWSAASLVALAGRVMRSSAVALLRGADRIDPPTPPTARNRVVAPGDGEELARRVARARHPSSWPVHHAPGIVVHLSDHRGA